MTFCGADAHGRGLSPGSGTTHEKLQVRSFEKSFVWFVATNAVPPAGSDRKTALDGAVFSHFVGVPPKEVLSLNQSWSSGRKA